MKHTLLILALFLLPFFAGAQTAKDFVINQPHPRLMMLKGEEAQIKEKISQNEFLQEAHDFIIRSCNVMLTEPVVKRELQGKTMLSISRKALERIYYLSYAWRMTGDFRYAQRAEKEMINVSNFSDWNPSHFLDVAEMTLALAIGYDWLFPVISDDTKALVRKAIIEKGINESIPETASAPENYSWLKKVNNWSQVCNTGMTFGAVVTYDFNPALSQKIMNRAVKLVRDNAMHEYLPNGNFPEGYTYWSYGTSFNVMLIEALEKLFGTSFGMTDNKGFMSTWNYIRNMTSQNLTTFNYSDCGSVVMSFPMFWFEKRLNKPEITYSEFQKFNDLKKKGMADNAFSVRFFPSLLLWADAGTMKNPNPPTQRLYVGQGKTPVAILRNHWGGKDEIFLAMKGGSSINNHAHMDNGSFVMYRGTNKWAIDAGIQEYYSLEKYGLFLGNRTQNSSRWMAFRFGPMIHNIVTFSGQNQRVMGYTKINSSGESADFVFATSNLNQANGGMVKNYDRGIAIVDNKYVVIRDEIQNIGKNGPIRWAMLTPATPKIIDKNTAELTQNGEKMILKVVGMDANLQTWSTDPPNKWDAPNPGTVLIGFASTLKPNEKAEITVYLIPAEEYNNINYQLPSLKNWK